MLNLLLLGVGGNVTQGILKAARACRLPIRIIGACVAPTSAGLYFCDDAFISPYADDRDFLPWLADLCRRQKVDIALSGVEEVLAAISGSRQWLERECGACFPVCGPDQLLTGRDKLATCQWLRDNGFAYPGFCLAEDSHALRELAQKCGGRLIAKPRFGKGSQGIFRAASIAEATEFAKLRGYVVEEEVGAADQEYTVGCYQCRNGDVHAIAFRRELTSGTTSAAIVSHNEEVLAAARDICRRFAPVGPLNIQMRLNAAQKPVCFELNVRFSGTTPMRAHFGFRDVEAAIREYALNEDASRCFEPRSGMALRFWEEIYVDEKAVGELEKSGFLADAASHATLPAPLLPRPKQE